MCLNKEGGTNKLFVKFLCLQTKKWNMDPNGSVAVQVWRQLLGSWTAPTLPCQSCWQAGETASANLCIPLESTTEAQLLRCVFLNRHSETGAELVPLRVRERAGESFSRQGKTVQVKRTLKLVCTAEVENFSRSLLPPTLSHLDSARGKTRGHI